MRGDKHDFQVAFTNHTAGEVTLTPKFSAKGARVLAAPQEMVVPAGATRAAGVTLQAVDPGAGQLVVSAQAPDGRVQAALPFRVNAAALLADPAARVASVSLAADVFYTGSGNPQVTLNGEDVGRLFDAWNPHPYSWYAAGTRYPLGEAAASAVANGNEVRLTPPGSMLFKVRNLALVVDYEDGRSAILRADPAVKSATTDAETAEGERVPPGAPMVWQCPAGN